MSSLKFLVGCLCCEAYSQWRWPQWRLVGSSDGWCWQSLCVSAGHWQCQWLHHLQCSCNTEDTQTSSALITRKEKSSNSILPPSTRLSSPLKKNIIASSIFTATCRELIFTCWWFLWWEAGAGRNNNVRLDYLTKKTQQNDIQQRQQSGTQGGGEWGFHRQWAWLRGSRRSSWINRSLRKW